MKKKDGSDNNVQETKEFSLVEDPTSSSDQTISPDIFAERLWQERTRIYHNMQIYMDDPVVPVVVLFGPSACGKTMTLIRVACYLHKCGYYVYPDRHFRDDVVYEELCDEFPRIVNSYNAAPRTCRLDLMLVEVWDKQGNCVCKILDIPGEDCLSLDSKADNGAFPRYMHEIINSRNRKIWVFMVEDGRFDDTDRKRYVAKIAELQIRMNRQDKAIVLFNKIDETPFVQSYRQVNTKAAFECIKHLYPGIFDLFRNANPIVRIFSKYRCKFIPFSTGSYTMGHKERMYYDVGPDIYPRRLWNTIMKLGKRYSMKHYLMHRKM